MTLLDYLLRRRPRPPQPTQRLPDRDRGAPPVPRMSRLELMALFLSRP